MESWAEIRNYKTNGKKCYQKYINSSGVKNSEYLIQACFEYGRGIEAMMKFEEEMMKLLPTCQLPAGDGIENNNKKKIDEDELIQFKQQFFLNLGIVNYLLNNYEECQRCCNASMVFCNQSDLLLSDLGRDHDLTVPIAVLKPVIPMYQKHVVKILFWRAKSLCSLGKTSLAILDLQEAHDLEPNDLNISSLMKEYQQQGQRQQQQLIPTLEKPSLNKEVMSSQQETPPPTLSTPSTPHLLPELTVNGGWCCQRNGFWSQSISEVIVYLPVHYLQTRLSTIITNSEDNQSTPLQRSHLKIEFHSNSILITTITTPTTANSNQPLHLSLMNLIIPTNSTWSLESHRSCFYLVLYLQKYFLQSIEESTPGMEWWEGVFEDDERIETLLCTIGSNLSELPSHARERAEKEHHRFQLLSQDDQRKQQDYLIQMKQEFGKSLNRTEVTRENEELSMSEYPERAEFLRRLRSEFPHIEFVSK